MAIKISSLNKQGVFWNIAVATIAIIVAAPILLILTSVFSPIDDIWRHISSTVLPKYISNSIYLMLGVAFGVSILGITSAWLVTMTKFPAKRVFVWAHMLPMAIPAYLLAYIYTDFLQFSGPVQTFIRSFGLKKQDYFFPEIRSIWGAIFILTLALYPYVYLLARAAFLKQAASPSQAAKCLSANPWRIFFVIALPIARPAIVTGIAIVLMETVSDFGTVDYFAIPTFTTGIYRTWFGMGDKIAAMKLAAILLLFVLALLGLEHSSRKDYKPLRQQATSKPVAYSLLGFRAFLAFMFNFFAIAAGFILPFLLIINMSFHNLGSFKSSFWQYARNSLILASSSSLIIVALAIILAYGLRIKASKFNHIAAQIASLGYAIPGTVIAVAIIMSLGYLGTLMQKIGLGFFFIGTLFSLIYAYTSRFLTVAFRSIQNALTDITDNMDNAAKTLGHGTGSSLFKIHIPLLRNSIYTALIIVFVDVVKELPTTLIIRPFNFDTLAIQIYRLASDERLAESASAALIIVLVGIIPVIFLSRSISNKS